MGRPKTKTEVTPGPSDYTTDSANKHIYETTQAQTMVFRPKGVEADRTPGPGDYSLPRILGPHTVATHAEPCYSMRWKSQYQSCFQDVTQTPGPAAHDKVDLDIYKTRLSLIHI